MNAEMERELTFHDDLSLVIKDAEGDNQRQIEHIREFIASNIDLLIVSPNEAGPITQIVEEAYNRGIPVVLLDRKTESKFYTSFVGADNYEIGKIAGNLAVNYLKSKGQIIEVKGLQGSTPFIGRHLGFKEVISTYPGITVSEVDGDWGETGTAKQQFLELVENTDVDIVFCHNDIMALEAYRAYSKLKRSNQLRIIGVDGLPGPTGGIQLVSEGIMEATVLYPTGGAQAIQVASNILNARPFQKDNILATTVIDSTNVRVMQMQTNQIISHQNDIIRLSEKLSWQKSVFRNQQFVLYSITLLLLICITLLIFTYRFLKERRKTNDSLRIKNEEIVKQRNEVVELATKAEEANQAKLKFFTNISHEFRTPLTLIMGPLDDLLRLNIEDRYRKDLKLIQKNALRLLRLINQLMDFRKIENGKMPVRASENEFVAFLRDISASFEKIALSRNIVFNFITDTPKVMVWFDTSMVDKVFFNLYSNAFKFTHDYGRISTKIDVDELRNQVTIVVEDNGQGMSREHVEHAFDRFYQGENFQAQGTGLGLSLSKELLELNHGRIIVKSEKDIGTRFEITLMLGKSHFQETEIQALASEHLFYEDETLLNLTDSLFVDESVKSEKYVSDKEFTVLIIDDHAEIRGMLERSLSDEFVILLAEDGQVGIKKAREKVPDLIISDIMMAKTDGIEVLKSLKADIKTSHIPVIMITAKNTLEDKLKSIKAGADDCITKPFNLDLLKERIRTTLQNRQKLREHYVHELPSETRLTGSSLDKKFINDFSLTVEEHLSDSNLSANELAEMLALSRVQLYRKVKALLGYSVNEYIVHMRLKKARHLLTTSNKPISEIATHSGFKSAAYFSTLFKSQVGLSPKEYKTEHFSGVK